MHQNKTQLFGLFGFIDITKRDHNIWLEHKISRENAIVESAYFHTLMQTQVLSLPITVSSQQFLLILIYLLLVNQVQ